LIKVSTIIPAYNAERTIAQAIDSALAQDCEGHEVVVIDDGSTDSTAAILQKYGGRIRVITQRNRGQSTARNVGVGRSTGKYLAFLDSDDIWLPGKLKTMVSALERNPLASLAFSEHTCIDDNGSECGASEIGHPPLMEELMTRLLPITPSTWVIPRQMLERTGGFCEEFKGTQAFEDFWMLLLLRELGEFVYVPEKLTLYRVCETAKLADKYAPGLPIFTSRVRERYGARGKALIQAAKDRQCRWLLSKTAHQMNDNSRWGAVCSLARIAKLRPTYFFSSEFSERLSLPHNTKRLRDLTSVLPRPS